MHKLQRVKVFTDHYPWLGPLIWILSVEFFIAQLVVAAAWTLPYDWRQNTISDLGSTACSILAGRPVCSPLHGLMNASLIALGIIMASGSLLIYQEFRESRASLLGFSLMASAGIGALLVGLFPENTVAVLHFLGASGPFLLGNLSLVVLGLALYKISPIMRLYTLLSGAIPLFALYLFFTQRYGSLGIGGVERVVAYPQDVWLISFGIYMSRNHVIYLPLRAIRKHLSASVQKLTKRRQAT